MFNIALKPYFNSAIHYKPIKRCINIPELWIAGLLPLFAISLHLNM